MGAAPDRSLARHQYAQQLVPIKARQLIGRAGYRRADVEEIQQDLFLYLHVHTDDYDPQRGAVTTFIARLVDACIAMMLRDRRRAKRATGFLLQSIDVDVTTADGDQTALAELMQESHRDRVTGGSAVSEGLSSEDRAAFEKVLERLADEPALRDILLRRMQRSTKGVADDLGISRRQLAKAIKQLRERFEAQGFEHS